MHSLSSFWAVMYSSRAFWIWSFPVFVNLVGVSSFSFLACFSCFWFFLVVCYCDFFHSDSFFYGLGYHTLEFCVVFWWCSVILPDYFFVVLLPSLFVVDFGLFQMFSWSSGCWLLLCLWCCGHYRLCPLFCICPSHLQWFLQCFFHTPLRRVCSLLLISPLGFCGSVSSTCMSFPGCWWGWVLCLLWVFYPRPVLAFGYCHRLRLCVCINHLLVRTITQPFTLESPNLDARHKTPWLRCLLFLGVIDLHLQGQI